MMGTYFKPLQRKIGVFTLLLACAFMAIWLRSHFWSDLIMIPNGRSVHGLESGQGMCVLFRSTSPGTTLKRPLWRFSDISQVTEPLDPWVDHAIIWQWNLAGGRAAVSLNGNNFYEDLVLSYADLVIPATLLSAWLLLWKPR